MLNAFPIAVIAGIALGFLAGLGIGGGSLLVLWLTLVLNFDHSTARMLNLMFFIPSALSACLFRWKQGSLNRKYILPAAISGCLTAAGASILSQYLDLAILKKIFGGLLIVTGCRELFYRPRKAR